MFDGEVYADFVVLWLLCHQSRVEGDPPEKCWLERWVTDAAQAAAPAPSTSFATASRRAIDALGARLPRPPGQHRPARTAAHRRRSSTQDYYRQLLRLVYRLLFLFVAEDRDLLLRPDADATARARYRRFYSPPALRGARRAPSGGSPRRPLGRRSASSSPRSAGRRASPRSACPASASSSGPTARMPDLDGAELANDRPPRRHPRAHAFTMTARPLAPSTTATSAPRSSAASTSRSSSSTPSSTPTPARSTSDVAAGNERKTTGSYYTPDQRSSPSCSTPRSTRCSTKPPTQPDPGSGASSPSRCSTPPAARGHFLIAAAHRIASRLAAVRTGDDEPRPKPSAHALRDVVGRCLYGIDVNPMAVELCKVSLWMEAVEPGKPLSSSTTTSSAATASSAPRPRSSTQGIPDDAFKALTATTRRSSPLWKTQQDANAPGKASSASAVITRRARPCRSPTGIAAIDAIAGDDTAASSTSKKAASPTSSNPRRPPDAKLAADAWCAAFVAPKSQGRTGHHRRGRAPLRLRAGDCRGRRDGRRARSRRPVRVPAPAPRLPDVFQVPLRRATTTPADGTAASTSSSATRRGRR